MHLDTVCGDDGGGAGQILVIDGIGVCRIVQVAARLQHLGDVDSIERVKAELVVREVEVSGILLVGVVFTLHAPLRSCLEIGFREGCARDLAAHDVNGEGDGARDALFGDDVEHGAPLSAVVVVGEAAVIEGELRSAIIDDAHREVDEVVGAVHGDLIGVAAALHEFRTAAIKLVALCLVSTEGLLRDVGAADVVGDVAFMGVGARFEDVGLLKGRELYSVLFHAVVGRELGVAFINAVEVTVRHGAAHGARRYPHRAEGDFQLACALDFRTVRTDDVVTVESGLRGRSAHGSPDGAGVIGAEVVLVAVRFKDLVDYERVNPLFVAGCECEHDIDAEVVFDPDERIVRRIVVDVHDVDGGGDELIAGVSHLDDLRAADIAPDFAAEAVVAVHLLKPCELQIDVDNFLFAREHHNGHHDLVKRAAYVEHRLVVGIACAGKRQRHAVGDAVGIRDGIVPADHGCRNSRGGAIGCVDIDSFTGFSEFRCVEILVKRAVLVRVDCHAAVTRVDNLGDVTRCCVCDVEHSRRLGTRFDGDAHILDGTTCRRLDSDDRGVRGAVAVIDEAVPIECCVALLARGTHDGADSGHRAVKLRRGRDLVSELAVVLDSLGAVAEHQALCGSGCDIVATGGHFGSAAALAGNEVCFIRQIDIERYDLCNRCIAVLSNLFLYFFSKAFIAVCEPCISDIDRHVAVECTGNIVLADIHCDCE